MEYMKAFDQHTAEIVLDHGLHRHVRCRVNDQWHMAFDVVTWPGYLSISGDMGTFVFSSIDDMFTFFRGHFDNPNRGYWAEKLTAVCRTDGHEKFSHEKFAERVREQLEECTNSDFREEVESILSHMDDYTEVELLRQLSEVDDGDWFSDFCEVRNNEHTVRYQWACHAIPWAIAQYDKQKGGEA